MSSPPVSFPRVFANEKGRVRRPHSSDELGVQFSTTIGVQVDITTAGELLSASVLSVQPP